MDPLPGTYYWKGVILVRAPDAPLRLQPKEKPKPLRPPIEPLAPKLPLRIGGVKLLSIA